MHHDVSPATDAHYSFSSVTRPLISHVTTDAHYSFPSVTRPLISHVPAALQNDAKLDAMAVNRTDIRIPEHDGLARSVNKHTIHSNAHTLTTRTIDMWEQIN